MLRCSGPFAHISDLVILNSIFRHSDLDQMKFDLLEWPNLELKPRLDAVERCNPRLHHHCNLDSDREIPFA